MLFTHKQLNQLDHNTLQALYEVLALVEYQLTCDHENITETILYINDML